MRVEGPVFVNIVVVMAMGGHGSEGEVAIEANVVRDPAIDDPSAGSVSVDDGIAGNLVNWMTIVGVVLDWHSTHTGGNGWKIKSEIIFR